MVNASSDTTPRSNRYGSVSTQSIRSPVQAKPCNAGVNAKKRREAMSSLGLDAVRIAAAKANMVTKITR